MKLIKKILLLAALTTNPLYSLTANESQEPLFYKLIKNNQFLIFGFIRFDSFWANRQYVTSGDKVDFNYPKEPVCDANCRDINNQGLFGFSPRTSRLYIQTQNIPLKSAVLASNLETDFEGKWGALRIRKAYFKIDWDTFSLLIGQQDHPLYGQCPDDVISFESGAPVTFFSRDPQIRFSIYYKKLNINLIAYAELDDSSAGPFGISHEYMSNSLTPGFDINIELETESFTGGIICDIKRLKPRLSTTTSPPYITEETITSIIGSAYGMYFWNNFTIKSHLGLGQNGTSFSTLGGYAPYCFNKITGREKYSNINFINWWMGIDYKIGKHVNPGVYIGFAKNLGSSRSDLYIDPKTDEPIFYGLDADLAKILKIYPRIIFTYKQLEFAIEGNWARTWFGKMNQKGKNPITSAINFFRFLFVSKYNF